MWGLDSSSPNHLLETALLAVFFLLLLFSQDYFLLILKNSLKKILLLQVLHLGKLVLAYHKENYFHAI